MALVTCRECGEKISDSALQCPRCGVPSPAGFGQLTVQRKRQLTGAIRQIEVGIDSQSYGLIKPGAELTFDLAPGQHEIAVVDGRGIGPNALRSSVFNIQSGQSIGCEVLYSQLKGLKIQF
jgi:hypothetical protein